MEQKKVSLPRVFQSMLPVGVKIWHGGNELLDSVAEKTKKFDCLNPSLSGIEEQVIGVGAGGHARR